MESLMWYISKTAVIEVGLYCLIAPRDYERFPALHLSSAERTNCHSQSDSRLCAIHEVLEVISSAVVLPLLFFPPVLDLRPGFSNSKLTFMYKVLGFVHAGCVDNFPSQVHLIVLVDTNLAKTGWQNLLWEKC